MISGLWVFRIGLFAGILVPLFGQVSNGLTPFQQGLTSGSSPTAITLGPDGACWFIESQAQQIGRITPAGVISEYPVPRANAGLNGIATGPDGALWFTEGGTDRIGRMTTDGVVTNEFALTPGSAPFGIVNGLDGAVWVTEQGTGKIGRMTPAGSVQEFPLPWKGSQLFEITVGPRGALWFSDGSGNIGEVGTTGAFTRFPLPNAAALPRGITPGPDNALWFTESAAGRIGRINVGRGGPPNLETPPIGTITEYAVGVGQPQSIICGPDGAFWFTETAGAVGRVSLDGNVTEFVVPWEGARLQGIVIGPDSGLWITDSGGRIVTLPWSSGGSLSEFPTVAAPSPSKITAGSDGALWFTADVAGTVGRINTAGAITTAYQAPYFTPYGIVQGSDGAMWFTDRYRFGVGKIAGTNRVEYLVPLSTPFAITAGPDGALWFTDATGGNLGRITTAGVLTVFPVPNAVAIDGITVGPDGALWFTVRRAGTNDGFIGRMTTSGAVTEYPVPTANADPSGIALGPDGALWFTESFGAKIGRITTSGAITEFAVPAAGNGELGAITAGPDGALWFVDEIQVYRITTSGEITAYPLPENGPGLQGITSGPDGALWFTEDSADKIGRLVPPVAGPPTTTRFFATNPPGMMVMVDGVNYPTPQSFTWPVGSRHTVGAVTPPAGAGMRYRFSGWSDGQSQTHMLTTGPGPSVYVANFVGQYQLTTSVSPAAAGSIEAVPGSADGYYDAGTPVQLTAEAYAGYQFAGWTGDAAGGGNPSTIVLDTARNAAAVFTGGACVVALTASSASMGAAGGNGSVGVVTDAACSWVVASAAPWVTIAGAISGTGSGTVTYSVAGSSGTGRTAVLTVGGQSFTITQGLRAVAVAPASGFPFTFLFSDPDGYDKIGIVNVLINSALDARQACYLAYSQPLGVLYLTNDQGVATGPGVPLNGIEGPGASNSQCFLTGGSAAASGTTLTLTLNLGFFAPFAGAKVIYLAVQDQSGNTSGWQALETWNVPGGSVAGPAVSGVTPAGGNTTGQTYTFTFTDSTGAQDLGVVNILIDAYLQGYGACYLAYSRPLDVLYLVDDSGSSLSTGLVLNGGGAVSNSQCRVYSTGSSAVLSGNTLILTLNLAFLPGFSGTT